MSRLRVAQLLLIAAALVAVSCNKAQDSNQVAGNQTASNPVAPNQTGDAAANGNLAPVAAGEQNAPVQQAQYQDQNQAPPPAYPPDSQQGSSAYYPDDSYDNADAVYAPQPPPPLPEYSQPPCPGDNYLWTPGYWDYASAGYYWVPGAWIMAPYVDALWTPPFWEFYSGRYRMHRGYWARHVGFYGGINYGHGYTGRGYYGGYWNNGRFAYNRAVTNVNTSIVHNFYDHSVPTITTARVSYNGGPAGVRVRPIPAEIAVLHETRTTPVPAQIQHLRSAESNRAQFAAVNRGRPAIIAQPQPLQTSYRAPAARPAVNEELRPLPQPAAPAGRATSPVPNRNEPSLTQGETRRAQNPSAQNVPAPAPQGREFGRPSVNEGRPQVAQRPEFSRPGAPVQAPQGREFGRPPAEARPQTTQPPENARPSPARPETAPPPVAERPRPDFSRQGGPVQTPQTRPEPQRFNRPEQPQPAPQARPEPGGRPFQQAAPQARPEPQSRPAPQPAPPPAPQPAARAPEPPRPVPQARAPQPPAARSGPPGREDDKRH